MGVVAVAEEVTAMRRLVALAIVSLFLLTPTFSLAHDDLSVKGETLLGWCKPQKGGSINELIGTYCYGFLAGVVKDYEGNPTVSGFKSCPNKHLTIGEIRNIVIDWVEKRSEKWQEGAHDLVGAALSDAFPCKQ